MPIYVLVTDQGTVKPGTFLLIKKDGESIEVKILSNLSDEGYYPCKVRLKGGIYPPVRSKLPVSDLIFLIKEKSVFLIK